MCSGWHSLLCPSPAPLRPTPATSVVSGTFPRTGMRSAMPAPHSPVCCRQLRRDRKRADRQRKVSICIVVTRPALQVREGNAAAGHCSIIWPAARTLRPLSPLKRSTPSHALTAQRTGTAFGRVPGFCTTENLKVRRLPRKAIKVASPVYTVCSPQMLTA